MENSEKHIPDKPMYYNYAIKHFLVKDSALFFDPKLYEKVIICVYSISTNGKYPFIQYLLSNNGFENMCLPRLNIFKALGKDQLINYTKVYLSGMIGVENFEEFNKKIEYNGYYEFEQNIYLFFDITNCSVCIDNNYSSCPLIFALIDEIINHCKICNMQISEETTHFFITNDSLNYLYNKNNEAYETPIVGFVGKPTPGKTHFTYIFGESPKNKSEMLGPYYYFTNFNNAIRQGGWSHDYKPEYMYNKLITDNDCGRYSNGGIVRFALFTGNTKYIENMPNSPNDESDIKNQRLNDSSLNRNFEIQTLRISDHNGLWTNSFDSTYLGNIELDDGSFMEDTPMIVLKEYNQQIPLSYHFIDKSGLGNKYEPSNHSYRIV